MIYSLRHKFALLIALAPGLACAENPAGEFLAETVHQDTLKDLLTGCFPKPSKLLEETDAQPRVASAQSKPPVGESVATNEPVTFYVSKLGDNSDGASWQTAFHSVQAALSAVPDDQGGHRVIVRPDTYMEANMLPSQGGARGAYKELIGDFDGSLGSGTTGHVVLEAGGPRKGCKS